MSEALDKVLEHLDEIDLDLLAEAEEDDSPPTVPEDTEKLSAEAAGYMELEGATKDGDCKIVAVEGGVSKELGCCNLFKAKAGAKKFNCGQCGFED